MENSIKCNHCGQEAEWVENKEVYGRNYGDSYMIYLCRACDAYVGCHNNTKEPKGRYLAKRDLREARKRAHAIIDPLWKGHKWKRKQIYIRLAKEFGRPIHVGDTMSVDECEQIILAAKRIWSM